MAGGDAPPVSGRRARRQPASGGDRWLVQDAHYVEALLRFQCAVLARAPRADQLVLAQGLVALAEELRWFDALAAERSLDLQAPLLPACRAYIAELQRMADAAETPYTALIAALWAIERAYLDAWRGARPGAPAYRGLVEHWSGEPFAEYVEGLAAAADRALTGDPEAADAARTAFLQICALERNFWQMALAG
jgi:thiaminase